MNQNEIPMGFGFALARKPEAMQKFVNLSEARQNEILQRVHTVSSKQEMQQLVEDLVEREWGIQ